MAAFGSILCGTGFADQSGIDFPDLDTYDKWEIDGFVGTMYAYSNYNSELKNILTSSFTISLTIMMI